MKKDDFVEYLEYMSKGDGLLHLAERLYLEMQNKTEALKKYNSAYNMFELAEAFAYQVNEFVLSHRAKERKEYCNTKINEISALIKLNFDRQQ